MLLTARDWLKYPTARIHYETKNTSFLKLANSYKNNFEVKNHAFLIAIIHPELAKVDPHDPNLDKETIALIYRECQLNPFYAIRECMRLPARGTDKPVMFEANRGNIATIWCFLMHMTYISIQPRQTGKSVALFTIFSLCLAVLCKNSNINFYTKDDVLRRESVKSIKEILNLLPPYLNPRVKKDPDNQEEIKYTDSRVNNSLLTHLPQKDKKQANNVCRGTTAPIFGNDEGPFCANSDISIPAAIAAGNKARQNAKAAGMPYGNIFTTTAGKLDDNEGSFMYSRLSASARWNEKFFDAKSPEHLEELIDINRRKLDDGKDPGPCVDGTFNHRQLGVPDYVHYDNIRQAGGDIDSINRDFFNAWSSGGRSNPISNDILAAISMSEQEPVYTEITNSGIMLNWYVTKEAIDNWDERNKIILGVDTSNAVGSDSCTGTMICSRTLEVIGTFNFNKGNLISFIFDFLADLMIRRKSIILIPENKINGQTVIDGLYIALSKKGIDPYRRIFNGVVQNKDDAKMKDLFSEINRPAHSRLGDIFSKTKKYFGFITAGTGEQSRNKLYGDVLETSTRRCKDSVRDKVLSKEIKAITVKNGRLDHPEGAHDDQLISWLLCHWLIMYGKNLSFYGIDTSEIRVKETKEMTKEDYYKEFLQNQIMENINELKEELKVTKDREAFEIIKRKLIGYKVKVDRQDLMRGIDSFISEMENDMNSGGNRSLSDLLSPTKKGFGGRMYMRQGYA